MLGFDALAAPRGDGLHPLLRRLVQERSRLANAANVVEIMSYGVGQPVQAGPMPGGSVKPFAEPEFTEDGKTACSSQ